MLKTTTDHNEIKHWIENLQGKPAKIILAGHDIAITIHFPPLNDSTIVDISWEEFFNKFDKDELAFQYEPDPADNKEALSHKFIYQEDMDLILNS